MTTAGMLAVALLLDAALGEPKWMWSRLTHPAVLMGKLVSVLDRKLNSGHNRRAKGVLAAAALAYGCLLPAESAA